MRVVRAIRAISPGSIAPVSRATDSASLRSRPLAIALDGVELGTWALGPRSLEELVRVVESGRPRAIIEFGSGASTVALAWAISMCCETSDVPRIVSIEQDAVHAQRTRDLLRRAGLESECVVLAAPLGEQVIEGRQTTCYVLPGDFKASLGERRADLIVIDGPAGPAGVRFGTLPLARSLVADGATFVLDDALRDGELDVARLWAALPYVAVRGIRLIEKGLLVGTVKSG